MTTTPPSPLQTHEPRSEARPPKLLSFVALFTIIVQRAFPTSFLLIPAKVPLLVGALCACTWHFFYNSESLEVLVALQAALTVIGNATMCIAAYRIYRSSERSKNL